MGFKPTLFGFGDQCFIRLSYERIYLFYQIFLKIFDKKAFQKARVSEYGAGHPFFNLFNTII